MRNYSAVDLSQSGRQELLQTRAKSTFPAVSEAVAVHLRRSRGAKTMARTSGKRSLHSQSKSMATMVKRSLKYLLRLYQKTRCIRKNCCRFHPSCSDYALTCLEQHSLWRALALVLLRILRCSPFSSGGHDPVPLNSTNNSR